MDHDQYMMNQVTASHIPCPPNSPAQLANTPRHGLELPIMQGQPVEPFPLPQHLRPTHIIAHEGFASSFQQQSPSPYQTFAQLHTPPPEPETYHALGSRSALPVSSVPRLGQSSQAPAPAPAPKRKQKLTMGPRADCEKCRLGIKGHWMHLE